MGYQQRASSQLWLLLKAQLHVIKPFLPLSDCLVGLATKWLSESGFRLWIWTAWLGNISKRSRLGRIFISLVRTSPLLSIFSYLLGSDFAISLSLGPRNCKIPFSSDLTRVSSFFSFFSSDSTRVSSFFSISPPTQLESSRLISPLTQLESSRSISRSTQLRVILHLESFSSRYVW